MRDFCGKAAQRYHHAVCYFTITCRVWHWYVYVPTAVGMRTDPYHLAELRYRLTRGVMRVLSEQRGIGVTIATKSPLLPRDIDVLTRINERSTLSVHVSLITVDRDLVLRLAPRSPTPAA